MSTAGVRGADPAALAQLARALDSIAAELEAAAGRLRAILAGVGLGAIAAIAAIDQLTGVARWCQAAANEARRVALLLLSDGRDWRDHRGFWGNVASVVDAEWRGIAEGTVSLGRGAWSVVTFAGAASVEPFELAWAAGHGDIDGVRHIAGEAVERRIRLLRGLGQSLLAAADVTNPITYGEAVRDDGFWRASRERAESMGEQLPGVALTVATSGIGASTAATATATAAEASLGTRVMSALGTAAKDTIGPGSFDPRMVAAPRFPASALDPTTQALTVAVAGDAGHRVGIDPATGDFVVDDGSRATEKRWSRLSDDERADLRDRGLVDKDGHLVGM